MGNLKQAIEKTISEKTGTPFRVASSKMIGGGCIHDARCLTGEDGRSFFVKQNSRSLLESFEAEAFALKRMADTRTIRVPEPVGTAEADGQAVLILEFLEMGGSRSRDWHRMGGDLARLHKAQADQFGWNHDNWIGSTPQRNGWEEKWTDFYAKYRLGPQVRWARERGQRLDGAEELMNSLPAFFKDYDPSPSLLHGDLWAGNADFLDDGTPVIFDPAAYYGDPEADLALTELFGGYPSAFYAGYESVSPIDAGYRVRKELYNLYHVLNHHNIFGGGYGSQAAAMIRRLVHSMS